MPLGHWSCGDLPVCAPPFCGTHFSTHQPIRNKSANVCTSEQIPLVAFPKMLACGSRISTKGRSGLRTSVTRAAIRGLLPTPPATLHFSVQHGNLVQGPGTGRGVCLQRQGDRKCPFFKYW